MEKDKDPHAEDIFKMGGGPRPRFKAHEREDIVKMGGIGQGYKAPSPTTVGRYFPNWGVGLPVRSMGGGTFPKWGKPRTRIRPTGVETLPKCVALNKGGT